MTPGRLRKIASDCEDPAMVTNEDNARDLRAFAELLEKQSAALESAIRIAAEIFKEWDSDNDVRVGKMLAALSGRLPGYRADIDTIHAALAARTHA